MDARLSLRPEEESRAASILKENDARKYGADTVKQVKDLGEINNIVSEIKN